MYKPAVFLGTMLTAATIAPHQAATYDSRLKVLETSTSCPDVYTSNTDKPITLDLVVKDLPRSSEFKSFKNPIPVGLIGYVKTDDVQRLAQAARITSDNSYIERIRKHHEEFWYERINGELWEPYHRAKGQQALDSLIKSKREVGAHAHLTKLYKNEFEQQVQRQYHLGNSQRSNEFLFKAYFRVVGANEYNKQLLNLGEKGLAKKAHAHFVEREMTQPKLLRKYTDDQGKMAYDALIKGHDMQKIFLAANEQARGGNGTLESNLRMNPAYKALLDVIPTGELADILDYKMVENGMKHEVGTTTFKLTYDTVPFVISSKLIQESLAPKLKQSDITLSVDATIGCTTRAEMAEAFVQIQKSFEEKGDDPSTLPIELLTKLSGIEAVQRHDKLSAEKALFYIVQELREVK